MPKKLPTPMPADGLTVREYIAQLRAGHSLTLSKIAQEANVPLTSLSMHMKHSTVKLSPKNAMKLQRWSGGKISAAKTLTEGL